MRKSLAHVLVRRRKQLAKRSRGLAKAIGGLRLPPLWLRFPDEAIACPACAARELAVLDVIGVRRQLTGRRIAFLTGCESCGLLFTNPLPSAAQVEKFYAEEGEWSREHVDRRARLLAGLQKQLARKTPAPPRPRKRVAVFEALEPLVPITAPPPGARVLDFGCGEGKLLDWLQPFGWETYGLEPSTRLASLKHHFVDAVPQHATFDFAVLNHVLEHVMSPLEILQQLAGALRPDGLLFIGVPRFDTVAEHGDFRYCINGRNHLLAFTETCLRHLLARAGFEVVATFHTPELDQLVTKGQPLRMRVLARRTATPVPLPPGPPLAAARHALAAYARRRLPARQRMAALLPARVRAPWVQRNLP